MKNKKTFLYVVAPFVLFGFLTSCKNRQTFTSTTRPGTTTQGGLPYTPFPGTPSDFVPTPGVPHPDLQQPSIPLPAIPQPAGQTPSTATPVIPLPADSSDYSCRANLKIRRLSKTPFSGQNFGSAVYQEVMEYAFNNPLFRHFAPFNPREPETDVHETLHGYGSYGRGYFRPYDSDAFHFLYLGNGEGVDLARSKTRKQDVIRYIPQRIQQLYSIRDSSQSPENFASIYFSTYITEQMNDGQPHHTQAGHLFEEWNCYIQDNKTSIELARSNRNTGTGSNFTATYFAIAAAYATSQVDPSYFQRVDPNNKFQFKAAFACLAEQAMTNFHSSPFKNDFRWRQNGYLYEHLKSNQESKHLRDFLYSWYGATWVNRVFRF